MNDEPAGTDNSVTILEDTAKIFEVGDFGFSDPSDTPPNNFSAVKITTLPGAGTLTNDGVSLGTGAFVTVGDIDAGKLRFSPAADASGSPYASFTFQVRDDGGTAIGGIDLDPIPNTMTINVIPLPWVATTSANCAAGDSPEVSVAGNAVMLGVERLDTQQRNCIHGASALLPPLTGGNTKYQVTFTYNLFTWDAYNTSGTVGFSGTGYWDSFSVSVSDAMPYQDLGLTDPITTSNLPGLGFIWGGNDFADSKLECNPSTDSPGNFGCTEVPAAQKTVIVPGNTSGNSYLNVVLDTKTLPQSNHAHPSYGTITILNVVQVP